MSIRDLALAVQRHLVLFIGCVFLAVGAAAYLALSARPTYTAQTQLFVSSSGSDRADNTLQNNNLALTRVPSYVELVSSPLVVKPVVEQLGLRESPEVVAQRIEATNPLGTALINVAVHDSTAKGAYDKATAIGRVFPTVIKNVETSSTGASPVNVTIVHPATVPPEPDDPLGMKVRLALGLLLGVCAGTTVAALRDRLDNRVRESDDLRTRLGLPPLAAIVVRSRADRMPLVIGNESSSSFFREDGFRRLRTNLQVLFSSEGPRSVVVAGPLARDGSSGVVVNLAVALGLAQVRVLLVGSNMRQGVLTDLLGLDGLDGRVGLSDVLLGTADVSEAIQPWRDGTIHVLPAGRTPLNPSELLASDVMRNLISTLEADYDVVLLDSPPLLDTVDGAVLAQMVGGTVLTVRRGRTRWSTAMQAVQALKDVNARVLGAVLLCERSRLIIRRRRAGGPGQYGQPAGGHPGDAVRVLPERPRVGINGTDHLQMHMRLDDESHPIRPDSTPVGDYVRNDRGQSANTARGIAAVIRRPPAGQESQDPPDEPPLDLKMEDRKGLSKGPKT